MRSMLFATSWLALALCASGALARDIVGTSGDDLLRGTSEADHMTGLSGHDDLMGFGGDDLIQGGDGFDELFGGAGNDTLEGGAGDDYLDGRRGDDTLTGGPGRDVFAFYALETGKSLDSGSDTITDFDSVDDVILLDAFVAEALQTGTDGAGVVITVPGRLWITLPGVTAVETKNLRFR